MREELFSRNCPSIKIGKRDDVNLKVMASAVG
jgi:hypothetical protein